MFGSCFRTLAVILFQILKKLKTRKLGKIQGDGWKFLDRLKRSFGSKISSQSLNEIHIYWLQPKSATKCDFFHIFLSLIVSSSRHMLTFDLDSQKQHEWFLSAYFGKTIVLTTQRSQIAIFSLHFPWFLIAIACLMRPLTFLGFIRHLQSMMPTWNKDKNIWKMLPFFVDFSWNW